MKVLVTVATRHGSTWMIGDAIREELAAAGHAVALLEPERVTDVFDYDAVVIGSAVYAGRWLKPAKELVDRFATELGRKPVWLFSSGPVGEPVKPTEPSPDALAIAERLKARDHRIFEGRLDRSQLGIVERTVVRVVGAEDGDQRPWLDITVWARGIARALDAEPAARVAAG